MPYFKNGSIDVLLIHIPKTGGSSVGEYFSSKFRIKRNNRSLYLSPLKHLKKDPNFEIESTLQHMTYNQIIKYGKIFDIKLHTSKIITIVRNPYERIVSDLFGMKLIKKDTTKETVFSIINKYLVSDTSLYKDYDNHNIPQHKFITNDKGEIIQNIHILKTETLTRDMRQLGYIDFNKKINVNRKKHKNYYDYLNNNSIDIINEFYHLDFVLFNYDKITR